MNCEICQSEIHKSWRTPIQLSINICSSCYQHLMNSINAVKNTHGQQRWLERWSSIWMQYTWRAGLDYGSDSRFHMISIWKYFAYGHKAPAGIELFPRPKMPAFITHKTKKLKLQAQLRACI